MKLRILPSAKKDLRRGFQFYEFQDTGIGAYFLDSRQATWKIRQRERDENRDAPNA